MEAIQGNMDDKEARESASESLNLSASHWEGPPQSSQRTSKAVSTCCFKVSLSVIPSQDCITSPMRLEGASLTSESSKESNTGLSSFSSTVLISSAFASTKESSCSGFGSTKAASMAPETEAVAI